MSTLTSVAENSASENVNLDGSVNSDQLTTEDRTAIKTIATAMAKGNKMFRDAYMSILTLLGFNLEELMAQRAEYFQPSKHRFANVMHQWASDYEGRLHKQHIENGETPNEATRKAENGVKNTKSAMMAWFRDEANIGIGFRKPGESSDEDVDLSTLTAKQLKNRKLKADAKALRGSTTELIKLLRDIVNAVINNDKARANDNKAEIDAAADKALKAITKSITDYHKDEA
jgi:hypothetical protein|tara:strand:- start:227 stop:916 length:690 start_codon:yes stop_codon:yes gene_type:complete